MKDRFFFHLLIPSGVRELKESHVDSLPPRRTVCVDEGDRDGGGLWRGSPESLTHHNTARFAQISQKE